MTPEAQVSRYGDTFVMYGTLHWYAVKKVAANEYFEKALSSASNQEQSKYYKQAIEEIKSR